MPTPYSESISIDSGDTPRTETASPTQENGHGAAAMPRQSQQSQRKKSTAKLTKLKPHFATPPRMSRQTDPHGGQNGQHADNEEAQQIHSGNTLDSYVLPKSLRMNRWDVNFLTSGIEVIKVSKVSTEIFVMNIIMGGD